MVHVQTPPPTTASRDEIIWLAGPRLIGLLFNWCLLGVLTTQVYIYHINFPKDKRTFKILVYTVYLLDWAQTCSATYDAFQWFVYSWGDIPALFLFYTSFLNIPIISSIIGAIVQIFYGWRIFTLSQSRILFMVVCVLALLQLGGGLVTAYYMFMDASENSRNGHLVRAVGVRLAGSALVDTVISVSVTYFLLRSRKHTLGPMTNVVTRLIRLTVETGTITVVAAVVDLVFFLREHNGLHQASGVILGKVYSNTLLVLFNNRLVDSNKMFSFDSTLAFGAPPNVSGRSADGTDIVDFLPLDTGKSDKECMGSSDHGSIPR